MYIICTLKVSQFWKNIHKVPEMQILYNAFKCELGTITQTFLKATDAENIRYIKMPEGTWDIRSQKLTYLLEMFKWR